MGEPFGEHHIDFARGKAGHERRELWILGARRLVSDQGPLPVRPDQHLGRSGAADPEAILARLVDFEPPVRVLHDADPIAVRLEERHNRFDQRGLPASARAHERDGRNSLARLEPEYIPHEFPGRMTRRSGSVESPRWPSISLRCSTRWASVGSATPRRCSRSPPAAGKAGRAQEGTEQVAEETPVAIVYNGIPHVVMMATPSDLEDFALGFSITEELIRTPADLQSLEVVRYGQGIEIQAMVSPDCEATIAARNRRLTGRTGCGICGADSIEGVLKQLHPVTSSATADHRCRRERARRTLVGHQTLNAAAGAVHAAGWASLDGEIQLAREDVGRHNALDKLIGAMLGRGAKPESGFLVVTSRASFEMVQKATVSVLRCWWRSRDPPALPCGSREHAGLTLVGFARACAVDVYTHRRAAHELIRSRPPHALSGRRRTRDSARISSRTAP